MSGNPLLWIVLLSVMGLAPFLLLTLTCFARISIVLLFVRHGLGVGNTPPNIVLNGLALLLSALIMAPVVESMHERATTLLIEDGEWQPPTLAQGQQILEPWAAFLRANIGERELSVAAQLRWMHHSDPARTQDDDVLTVATAFLLTELGRAVQAGVFVLLPFLLIDLLVGLILLALGMHMLSPTSVTPALKLLFFVVAEGWMTLSLGLRDGYNIPLLPPLP